MTCCHESPGTSVNWAMVSNVSAPSLVRRIVSQIGAVGLPGANFTQAVMLYLVPTSMSPVTSWPMPSPWPVRFETRAAWVGLWDSSVVRSTFGVP